MKNFSYLDDLEEEIEDSYQRVQPEDEQVVKANSGGNGFGEKFNPEESSASPYQPKELNARHREILRLHSLGYKGTEIANVIGCTPQLVYMTVNSPLGEAFLQEIEEARTGSVQDVRQRLQEMSPLAAEVLLDIMNNGAKEHNRLKAAKEVLEKTDQGNNENHNHRHVHLTKQDIEDIKKEHSGGPQVHSENGETKRFNESNHKEITQPKSQEDG